MGVTIHFEGTAKNEGSFARILKIAENFASTQRWSTRRINEESITLHRVRDEKDWDYTGSVRGIEVQPHPNADPLRLEFDTDLFVQEYCKTQFAPIKVHIAVIKLLAKLEPEFSLFSVEDEGEFWSTGDSVKLQGHFQACFAAMEEHLASDQSLEGPVRVPSGRMLDLVSRD